LSDTHKTANINFISPRATDIIKNAYYIHKNSYTKNYINTDKINIMKLKPLLSDYMPPVQEMYLAYSTALGAGTGWPRKTVKIRDVSAAAAITSSFIPGTSVPMYLCMFVINCLLPGLPAAAV